MKLSKAIELALKLSHIDRFNKYSYSICNNKVSNFKPIRVNRSIVEKINFTEKEKKKLSAGEYKDLASKVADTLGIHYCKPVELEPRLWGYPSCAICESENYYIREGDIPPKKFRFVTKHEIDGDFIWLERDIDGNGFFIYDLYSMCVDTEAGKIPLPFFFRQDSVLSEINGFEKKLPLNPEKLKIFNLIKENVRMEIINKTISADLEWQITMHLAYVKNKERNGKAYTKLFNMFPTHLARALFVIYAECRLLS